MNRQIWVVVTDMVDGRPSGDYYELICKATELASDIENVKIAGVIVGNNLDTAIDEMKKSGADIVYTIEHEKLSYYNCQGYATAICSLIKEYDPELLLIGATSIGSELGPTIAAKLKTGLAAHSVDIKYDNLRYNCMVPAFGGKMISEIYVSDTRPAMASVRPGMIEANVIPAKDSVEEIRGDADFLDTMEIAEVMEEFEPIEPSGKDIAASDCVIAAGRGAASYSAWKHLQQVADALDIPIGYTRSFVDMGNVADESQLIGTSGRSIKPKVIMNFGISGASHYVCGINKVNTIISINKDEKAKIFQHSDYGVIGDADKILQVLLAKLSN